MPSCFLTICRGEAQRLVEHLTIPACSRARNSFLAAASFYTSSCRNLEAMGGPLVWMWCATSSVVHCRSPLGLGTSWNSTHIFPMEVNTATPAWRQLKVKWREGGDCAPVSCLRKCQLCAQGGRPVQTSSSTCFSSACHQGSGS